MIQKALFPRHFNKIIGLDDIVDLHLVKALKDETAVKALADLLDVVLESLERSEVSFKDLLVTPADTDFAAAADDTVEDHAAGDIADMGCLEEHTDFGMADDALLVLR